MLNVSSNIKIPLSELKFSFSRSSGSGGQNVNKVNTKATLRWDILGSTHLINSVRERFLARFKNRITKEGYLVLSSDRFRSQDQNVSDCLEKLESMLRAVAQPPKKRKRTRPSKTSKRKRLDSKKRHGEKKQQRRRPHYDD